MNQKKLRSLFSVLALLVCPVFSAFGHASESYLVLYKQDHPEIFERGPRASKIQILKTLTDQREKEVFSRLDSSGESERESLWLVHGTMAFLSREQVKKLREDLRVADVRPLNRLARLTELRHWASSQYTYGLENIGLPGLMLRRPDLDGTGMRVGIIDTGIDANHPDLRGRVQAFRDFISNQKQPYDDHGHGTHVAGIVGGGDRSGAQIGVAPKVQFVIAKGFGRYGGFEEKGLLQAMQWMADPDQNPQTDDAPHVLSSSWNVDGDVSSRSSEDEVFCMAIDRLKLLGVISVFSAGNDGPSSSSVKIPGACPGAITVGSVDQENVIANSSSRGPVKWKNKKVEKPEVVAPGVSIYSSIPGGSYGYKSGTSMATPYVAGALALVLQNLQRRAPDEARAKVLETALDLGPGGFDSAYGFGLIDLPSSILGIWTSH